MDMAEKQYDRHRSLTRTAADGFSSRGARSVQLALEKIEAQKQAVEKAAEQRQKRLEKVSKNSLSPLFLPLSSLPSTK